MRKTVALMICIGILSCTGIAGAVPWTWTDVIDPTNNVHLDASLTSYSYQHNITDNGFNPLADLVWDYDLSIDLVYGTSARVRVDLPGIIADTTLYLGTFQYEDINLGVSLAGLFELNLNGTLSVNVIRRAGDFYFDSSTLVARGWESNPAAPVPEPSTLMLLGSGLSGLGVWQLYRRKPRRKI